MDGQSRPRVELLVADVTLEMLRLLMLHQNLFIVELAIAVPVWEGKSEKSRARGRNAKLRKILLLFCRLFGTVSPSNSYVTQTPIELISKHCAVKINN